MNDITNERTNMRSEQEKPNKLRNIRNNSHLSFFLCFFSISFLFAGNNLSWMALCNLAATSRLISIIIVRRQRRSPRLAAGSPREEMDF